MQIELVALHTTFVISIYIILQKMSTVFCVHFEFGWRSSFCKIKIILFNGIKTMINIDIWFAFPFNFHFFCQNKNWKLEFFTNQTFLNCLTELLMFIKSCHCSSHTKCASLFWWLIFAYRILFESLFRFLWMQSAHMMDP